ncbi:mucoidy inhibitor MuiA family protein [Aquimarina brevivitae]|uniref:Uncharacterized protein (TIGR02231 family) n=1 Tax=Aquimarina brevivitae TaxID=323412 RepID=A0A4Q7P282_9FLAO|nr:mucoidy inhibitor MuiA family protein [Aquimarina brevivitae]RZS93854.1 uncharacterized protein (TIGR02231 family) [Aquimarina brevivitae]
MQRILLLIGLISLTLHANTKIQQPNSTIEKVTVYLSAAKIERVAKLNLLSGQNTIVLTGLSPLVDENSIQLTGLKNTSVTSISFAKNAMAKKAFSDRYLQLEQELLLLNKQFNTLESELKGLEQELQLYQNNQQLKGNDQSLSLQQVKDIAAYYSERIKSIEQQKYDIALQKDKLGNTINDVTLEKNKARTQAEEERGEIIIELQAQQQTQLSLGIGYIVSGAGWVPGYELRATTVDQPLSLAYKATVYQLSGTDWNDVNLVLSTADPYMNTTRPIIAPKFLNFTYGRYTRGVAKASYAYKYNPLVKRVSGVVTDEQGLPLPGVNVVVKGTTTGTQTDSNGQYSLDNYTGQELVFSYLGFQTVTLPIYASHMPIRMESDNELLEEVVVTGYSYSSRSRYQKEKEAKNLENFQDVAATTESLIAKSFVLKNKYSIPSGNESTHVAIDQYELAAHYEYYAAPELNENVFLTASIQNWEELDLLAGEAKVYFNGNYAGKSYIDPIAIADSLTVSMGVDPSIVIKREELKNQKATSFMGSNRIVDKAYSIQLKNNTTKAVSIIIEDRIPVSQDKEIKVDDLVTGTATYTSDTGILQWKLTLQPKEKVSKSFSYRVKYPKQQRINL